MSIELIYKTSELKAVLWWQQLERRRAEVQKHRREYEDKALEEFGPMGSRYNYGSTHSEHENARRLIVSSHRAVGLSCRIDEEPPEGSGWRLDSKEKWWFPKLATAAGRKRRDELIPLHLPNEQTLGQDEFGIPAVFFAGQHMYRPGYTFREDTQELFVVWSSYECRNAMLRVHEPTDWEMVSREDWYAWREEIDAVARNV